MGKAIKLSAEVMDHLEGLREEQIRKNGDKFREGYDACLRRHFGLPTKAGKPQRLRTYFLIDNGKELLCRRSRSEARGDAIILAVKRGQKLAHKERKDEVLEVREVPR